jgi:uncharacterized protein YaeQ
MVSSPGRQAWPVICFALAILSSCCGIFNFASIGKSGEGRLRFLSLFRVEFKGVLMALKPKIYKFKISLSDIDRDYYDTLNLTIAQHPSETLGRMMVRVLAFCINAQEQLAFTKGLCAVDEPDIWARTLDDQIALWIDVGEPSVDRIKKATRLSPVVKVYSFNSKSDVWWEQGRARFSELRVSVFRFQRESIQALAALLQRTMDLSVTITGDSAYVAAESGECEVFWVPLQAS